MRVRAFRALAAGVLGGGALLAGCRTAIYYSTGVGTYRLDQRFNAWETTIQAPVERVHAAVVAGLADLGVTPVTSQVDKVSGLVDALFADQMDLAVKLSASTPELTRLRIRCGLLGDRARADRVFRAIAAHL